MQDGYKTLEKEASDSFIIKKSRFTGYGSPARSEQEALDFLARIKAETKDANHHCYAYIIGRNAGVMRYSDDGEPGGTAGLPIIETMKARGVVDCAVVVTRWFGGILLGAGGLTRAYVQGAKCALDAARVVTMEDSVRFWAEVPYSLWDRLDYALNNMPVCREGTEFSAQVTATLVVRKRDRDDVFAKITAATEGRAEMMELEELVKGWG